MTNQESKERVSKRLCFDTVDFQVDPTVDAIASGCGVAPEIAGLIMSAIIGGLTRHDHQTVPGILSGIPPGLNLVLVGADESPRVQWLLSLLLAPLMPRQARIRNAASACRRERLDQMQHGTERHY